MATISHLFFFQAEDGIRDTSVTGVQTCALPISLAEAYIYHHFFELACRAQVGALAGGAELITPAPEVCEERAKKFGRIGQRSEERRVGKEGRSRWAPYEEYKKR